MSIIRNKLTRKFTTIPNQIITDCNLSPGALRVYLYLLSKPDGWKVINSDIQKQLNIKQAQTLANFWKELINLGWISRYRIRDKDNKITGGYDYELNETPVLPDHNIDKPINRENPQYINNTKEQEHNKTDLNNTYTPTPLPDEKQSKTQAGIIMIWLSCIKVNGYQFTDKQVQAISAWTQYKIEKKEQISLQQIELTLKHLNGYVLAKQDIVYLIENSIARGYKGIMEPTKNSINPVSPPLKRYSSDEYIIPENPAQKIELRDYIIRCYMFDKLDPRTKEPLTKEQINLLREHFQIRDKRRMSHTDYIY